MIDYAAIDYAHPGLQQTSTTKRFPTAVNPEKPLTIIAKRFILDICGSPGKVSMTCLN